MKSDQRTIKGLETKNNIIQASIEILAEQGVEGLSAKKISDALKISKSNIFHHFKSVDMILEQVFDSILMAMVEPIKNHSFESPRDFFIFMGQGIYKIDSQERKIYIVLFQFYTLSLYNKKYQTMLINQKKQIVENMAQVLENISLSDSQVCHRVSEMVLMTLDGYGLSALLDEKNDHYEKLWQISTSHWCHLLSENKGGNHGKDS